MTGNAGPSPLGGSIRRGDWIFPSAFAYCVRGSAGHDSNSELARLHGGISRRKTVLCTIAAAIRLSARRSRYKAVGARLPWVNGEQRTRLATVAERAMCLGSGARSDVSVHISFAARRFHLAAAHRQRSCLAFCEHRRAGGHYVRHPGNGESEDSAESKCSDYAHQCIQWRTSRNNDSRPRAICVRVFAGRWPYTI